MEPVITISNLEKTIDEFHLGPIDLSIEPGTVTALIGNNGSGKSTILKAMMNLVQPDKGEITFNRFHVGGDDESWKKDMVYLPQKVVGWDPFTGELLKEMIAPLYPKWDEVLFQQMIG